MMSWAVLALALVSCAHAHMRFVCPRPESANSGIKSGPCSDEKNEFEKSYVDLTPGPLTLRFEETINHKGAPLRLTLNKYGDSENICMLLDQYPHNENGTMNIGDACWPFGWPLGGCITQHYVTVNIPDIKCDKCFLQLVSVMTDKYTDAELPCHQVNQATNNCSSYFSCANVKIRPTAAGNSKDISTCTDYKSNLVGDWPYKPMDMFQSEMTGTQKMKAQAEFDVLNGNLVVTLPTLVSSMASQMSLVFLHGESELGSAEVKGQTVEWAVPQEHQALLRKNEVTLSLKDSSKSDEMSRGTLELMDKKFERDYYRRHGKDLTPAGWLQEAEFVGPSATYPFAMQPHGACVLDTKYYGASKVDTSAGSVVSLTLTDLHAWVRGTSSRTMSKVSFYDASGVVKAVEVPKTFFSADGHHFDGVLDMTSVVRGGRFFNKVEVTLGPENDQVKVSMALTEATVAPVNSNGKRVGETVVQLQAQAKLAVSGVVSFPAGSSEKVLGLGVHGPARSNAGGNQLVSFSVTSAGTAAFGSGVTTSSLSLAGLDALHAGQVYVNFNTEGSETTDRPVSGQLPPRKECKSNDNSCLSAKLTFGGGNVNRYLQKLDTNGYATFKAGASSIEYQVTLRDMQRGETVTSVYAEDSKDSFNSVMLHEGAFTASTLEDNVQTLTKTLSSPPAWLKGSLARGELTIKVYTSVYVLEPIFGTLPAISALY